MNRMKVWIGVLVLPLGLASCGTMKSIQTSTAKMVAKLPALPRPQIFGDRPKVVEVREKDLKKMPLGHEQALAFQKTGGFNFWPRGNVKFEPGPLPEPGSEMDGSLLPPLAP